MPEQHSGRRDQGYAARAEAVYASAVRASSRAAIAAFLTAVVAAAETSAETESWIALEAPASCVVTAAELQERVSGALVGRRASGLAARVHIEEADGGYHATLSIERGGSALGESGITAPTCDEAVDAAVLALALALGERETPVPELATPEHPAPPAPEPSRGYWPREARGDGADALSRTGAPSRESQSQQRVRVSLMTGLDSGTLAGATPYAAAGLALVAGRFELRGGVRYGFPRVEDDADAGRRVSVRREFAALDAGACYGVGEHLRFSTCGGGELGVTRHVQRLRAPNLDADEEDASPRLSGVVRALFAHRGGFVQPELELSGLAVALGRHDDARWLAVRVAVGAAVQF